MKPAVFLDRDGTLIEEAGYLDRIERLTFFPFSVDAVRLLNRSGLPVVVVSNQSGVARGLVREAFVAETHQVMAERLAAGGARVDAFYYCPHHPDGAIEAFRRRCDCRKPQPGLFRRAAADLDLDLARSFVVGDRWLDVEAAASISAKSVLVRTGYGRAAEAEPRPGVTADRVADNLIEAVSWILRHT